MTDPWSPSPLAVERARKEQEAPPSPSPKGTAKPKIPEAPSTAQRKASLAIEGKLANPNTYPHAPFPGYNLTDLEYEINALTDEADLRAVMHSILLSRQRLFLITRVLSGAQRRAVEAKYEWKSALNRKLLSVSGGTEKDRLALAELSVEKEWADYLAAEQESEDALNLLRAVRTELDSLQNISYNIRAQMQML